MQELFVHADEVGINGQTVAGDGSTCERAGQGPAGEQVLQKRVVFPLRQREDSLGAENIHTQTLCAFVFVVGWQTGG